jgi:hypothetical protein
VTMLFPDSALLPESAADAHVVDVRGVARLRRRQALLARAEGGDLGALHGAAIALRRARRKGVDPQVFDLQAQLLIGISIACEKKRTPLR